MRFYVKARKVVSVNDEHEVLLKKGTVRSRAATVILELADSDHICAKCIGKDKVAIMNQKARSGMPVELIITMEGRVLRTKDERTMYTNEVHIKWILE